MANKKDVLSPDGYKSAFDHKYPFNGEKKEIIYLEELAVGPLEEAIVKQLLDKKEKSRKQ